MKYLLALDQGTSSSRSIVFDADGRIVAQAQREITQGYPRPGWVEHDPVEIWNTQLETAREALSAAKLDAKAIAAIGITNQRETTIVWERASGRPIHPAIVWQDRRGEPICEQLREAGLAPLIAQRTGLVVDAYFSGTKIRWLLDNVAGAREAAERGELAFGTVDSWLVWQLTGGRLHLTDVSNASRTMLYDIGTHAWSDELCALFDVPRACLPEVRPSSGRFGMTDPNLAAPGKRMLSSMTPTILARDGAPYMVIGSPGGRTIINTVLLCILNVVDFGMNVQDAVDFGRFHHQWLPDRIQHEPFALSPDTLRALAAKGHALREGRGQGAAQGIVVDAKAGLLEGGYDRRSPDSLAVGVGR